MPSRRLLACCVGLLAAVGTGGAVVAVAQPGSGQASAVVNDCGGVSPGAIGVGAYVPARGGASSSVRISVEYYSTADGGWHPAAKGDSGWYRAGAGHAVQTGYTFPYQGPSAWHRLIMRGVVSIRWSGGDATTLTTDTCEIGAHGAAG